MVWRFEKDMPIPTNKHIAPITLSAVPCNATREMKPNIKKNRASGLNLNVMGFPEMIGAA